MRQEDNHSDFLLSLQTLIFLNENLNILIIYE